MTTPAQPDAVHASMDRPATSPQPQRSFWLACGPGLLFAGAAVGVSHLVQSTRAGAVYGLSLVSIVILANMLKYPAFRFGPLYAAATGHSLLEGYRRQGRWALILYAIITIGTMFTVQAAVTVVTAGLAQVIFVQPVLGLDVPSTTISVVLLLICASLLGLGDYSWLDRIIKVVVAVLTVSTVMAAVLILPTIDWQTAQLWPSADLLSGQHLFFLAALIGWMPTAVDISVWHSLWTLARRRDVGHASVEDTLLDFNIGYVGTAILALCFLVLGAGVMHGKGVVIASGATGFARQIIDLYAATLGEWTRPLIGVCAFAVMLSTTLTVVDGFPRALSVLIARFRRPEVADDLGAELRETKRAYWLSLVVLCVGSIVVLHLFLQSLKAMVDLATTLSFLTAPILAWLNHRAVFGGDVPPIHQPSDGLRWASWIGLFFLSAFALLYLWLRFLS